MTLLLDLVVLTLGFAMLVRGADVFVGGAASIARRLGIPSLIVGLTIVAMGTSAPEAAISITSALRGAADITIGNVIGSNILNILMVLGLTSAVSALAVEHSTVQFEIPFMIVVSTVLLTLGVDGQVGLVDGLVLWACFLVYMGYLFFMGSRRTAAPAQTDAKGDGAASTHTEARDPQDAGGEQKRAMWMLVLLVILGIVMVVWGSNLTVDSATRIARAMGMSERMIGLTIIALGTSLPELVTCITAARKGEADIAIGNIVGSCIFNVLFVVGSTALVATIPFASEFKADMAIAIGSASLLWMCVLPRKRLSLVTGLPLLVGFVAYLVYLVR